MKKHILVVDDEQAIREICKDLLELKEYKVTLASDGFDALGKIKLDNFDLFLIDMTMPGMDGYELIAEIKKIQPLAVIIVFTGYSSIEGAVKAIHAGAYQYISKPIKSDELYDVVEKGLRYSETLYGPMQKGFDPSADSAPKDEAILVYGFNAEEKSEFLSLGEKVQYSAGETINYSQEAGSILILESGDVSIWITNTAVDFLKRFDSWGEESFLLSTSAPAVLRSETDVTISVYERKRIIDFFANKPEELMKKFLINISTTTFYKWRKALQRIVMLKLVTSDK